MNNHTKKGCCFVQVKMLLFIINGIVFADYVENIDTTSDNGWSKDSLFWVASTGGISVTNKITIVANYCICRGSATGYFNYSFNDIKTAPRIIRLMNCEQYGGQCPARGIFSSFAFYINIDSLFEKIQIIQKLAGGRYIYKSGKNTVPNNKILEKSDYDQSIRYKPNNLYFQHAPYLIPEWTNYIIWDPPLPNNNHLLGYILYKLKKGIAIDTTAAPNLSQFDSIAWTSSDTIKNLLPNDDLNLNYYNIVAVYSEGKSDFLNGWTNCDYSEVGIKANKQPVIFNSNYNFGQILQINKGILFNLPTPYGKETIFSLNILSITGQQVEYISDVHGNYCIWNSIQNNYRSGVYIAKAQLSDKRVISKPFMVTR